jgi:hypothetical protein
VPAASAATAIPTTAPDSSSHTGEPLKPGTIGCSPGAACIWNHRVPCLPRNRPVAHTPSAAPAGKPSTRKAWSHSWSTRRNGGIRAPSGSGSRTRSTAMSPVPSGAMGIHRATSAFTRAGASASASTSRGRSSAIRCAGGRASYGSPRTAAATTWAQVATRSSPTTHPAPTGTPAGSSTRTTTRAGTAWSRCVVVTDPRSIGADCNQEIDVIHVTAAQRTRLLPGPSQCRPGR